MSEKYEQLIEENTQLKKALISSKSLIDRITNDYETIRSIHEDIKLHYEKSKRDLQEQIIKVKQLQQDKRELEQQFDTTIRNLKMAIEQKQREIEEIQQKVIPSFDQDMLRIRVINELEIPHRQQLEQRQNEIDKLQEQVYFLKRQVDLAEAKVETIHQESLREIKIWNEKHKIEVEDYLIQISELTKEIESNTDRDVIRRLKKELDEYKARYTAMQSENEELRIDRDRIREEHNETLVKFSRQIDQERTDKRNFRSEAEKVTVRLRFTEDELRKEKIRRDQMLSDMEMFKSEKDTHFVEMRKKDDTIHYLQNKLRETEENHLINEQKYHENSLKMYNEEHDKYLQERNKAITSLKDLDSLKKRFSDLNDDYKALKDRYLKDQQEIKDDKVSISEEREKLKKTIQTLQRDNQELERVTRMKDDQLKDLDNECESLRKRNRDLAHKISLTETYGSEQRPSPKTKAEVDPNQLKQIQELEQENIKLQGSLKKMKDKLKQANQKIMELLTKKLQDKQQQPQYQPFELNAQELEDEQIYNRIKQLTQPMDAQRQGWQ